MKEEKYLVFGKFYSKIEYNLLVIVSILLAIVFSLSIITSALYIPKSEVKIYHKKETGNLLKDISNNLKNK